MVLCHGPTGELLAVLGSHDGLVYSVAWAADDSAVVTASADMTAKVWHLPRPGGSPGSPRAGPGPLHLAASLDVAGLRPGAAAGRGRGGEGEEGEEEDGDGGAAWPAAVTLQHACYVYAAAFCPLPGLGPAVVATGGYDGALRLWDARPGAPGGGGLLLYAAQARGGRTCLP